MEKETKFDYEQFLSSNIIFNKVIKRYEVSLPFTECYGLLHDNIDLPTAKRRAIFRLLNRLSVVVAAAAGHHLRTSDENDLQHVMDTDSSLETCPFATFRPPSTLYNLFKLFFYID